MLLGTAIIATLLSVSPAARSEAQSSGGAFSLETATNARAAVRAVEKVFQGQRKSFFCGCPFDRRHRAARKRCANPPASGKDSKRIVWTRLIPTSRLAGHLPCWAEGGDAACRNAHANFRAMATDLFNFVPVIAALETARAGAILEVSPEPTQSTGPCGLTPNSTSGTATIAYERRGELARVYLYFHWIYGADTFPLSSSDKSRYRNWHHEDPPTPRERQRGRRIGRKQGVNPVELVELVAAADPEADEFFVGQIVSGQPRVVERINLDKYPGCCRFCDGATPCGARCIGEYETCEQPPGSSCACVRDERR